MSIERDPGWVYEKAAPPARCRCGGENVAIGGVLVCPSCDDTRKWPVVAGGRA
jgi:hypothetical protein